jgi:hypothetical protein
LNGVSIVHIDYLIFLQSAELLCLKTDNSKPLNMKMPYFNALVLSLKWQFRDFFRLELTESQQVGVRSGALFALM